MIPISSDSVAIQKYPAVRSSVESVPDGIIALGVLRTREDSCNFYMKHAHPLVYVYRVKLTLAIGPSVEWPSGGGVTGVVR